MDDKQDDRQSGRPFQKYTGKDIDKTILSKASITHGEYMSMQSTSPETLDIGQCCSEPDKVHNTFYELKTKHIIKDAQATKNNVIEGKPMLSLLPLDLLEEVARAYEYGMTKYSRNNFRKGLPQSVTIDSCLRHISKYFCEGQIYDSEAYESTGMKVNHLGMAIFGLLCAIDAHRNHSELVERFVPDNYKSEVPLSKDEEKTQNALQEKWINA